MFDRISDMPIWFMPIILILLIWSLIWKALALWHSAKKGNRVWFILLLVINSLGILELFYLFYVEKVKTKKLFK